MLETQQTLFAEPAAVAERSETRFLGRTEAKGKCVALFFDQDGRLIYHLPIEQAELPKNHPSLLHPYHFHSAHVVEIYSKVTRAKRGAAVPCYVQFPIFQPPWHDGMHAHGYDLAQTDFFIANE